MQKEISYRYRFVQIQDEVPPIKKYQATKIKIHQKIRKLSLVRLITSKIKPTKNIMPDLRIKSRYLAIKEHKIPHTSAGKYENRG